MSPSSIPPSRRERARELRNALTPPERMLWQQLKSLNATACHFRRQVPIGPYVANFAWLSRRVIVELDGHSHDGDAACAKDAVRQGYVEAQGFTVLRFANADVLRDVEGVVATIVREVGGDE